MKKLRNSPLALATAAMIATPPAIADPVSLAPPPAQTPAAAHTSPARVAQPTPPTAPVVHQPTPPSVPQAQAAAPLAPLRGEQSSLPQDFAVNLPPAPPPPPPAAAPAHVAQAAIPPAPPSPPPPPRMAPAPGATVTVGEQPEYTRLAFAFQSASDVTPSLNDDKLDLRFTRVADIDLSELRANHPHLIRDIRRVSAAGAPLRLSITLDPGVQQRHFTDGNRVVVDLLPPAPGSMQASSDGQVAPAPAARPVSGNARVQLVEEANDTQITVQWPAPARAAAFRRGEAIWVLFDATGRIDLNGVARAGRLHQDIEVVRGEGVIGLRIPAPPEISVSAAARNNSWTFTLAPHVTRGDFAGLDRIVTSDGKGSLVAHFAREGVVRWIQDPEIGDRIAVALFGGPAEGVDTRRATVEASLLPSAHGAVVETRADGVTVSLANGDLTVGRSDQGLIAASAPASHAQSQAAAQLNAALTQAPDATAGAAAPQNTIPLQQVRARIDTLERAAASEGTLAGAPTDARLALAKFLLDNDFAAEALGALRVAAINQGDLVEIDPTYRLMRGEASAMMGRYTDADNDLGASALAQNPTAALWRGYAAAEREDWANARRQLEQGAGALEDLSPTWRARFQLALAKAAFELGDYAAADSAQSAAIGEATDQSLRLQALLLQARIAAARNDNVHALQMLDELSRARDEETAVRATLESTRIRLATGVMRPMDAIEPLEALRFRWRGDAIELQTVSMLGDAYSQQGRWRDALEVMQTASDRFPNDPAARQLRVDMATLFEQLFLDGEADQLQPIEALGLFYEFSDLTPIGPNGDRMVRLLAGRLVNVDLLEQAAQLLQHQVDERLQGLGKAQVAADLAAIYLMDHKPDKALVAIDTTRQPNMPPNLLADRHILEARALLDLGRLDSAVELVERDRSQDAQRVRAEAAWRAHDWDRAAAELKTLLGMRPRGSALDQDGRQQVLRTAVALTLAGNDDQVRALYREYAGDMAHTDEADAFEVVASGINADGSAIRDVARAVARTDVMDRFMQRIRANMTVDAHGNPLPAPATPGAPAPQTPAAPVPQAAPPPSTPNRPTGQAGT
ncbi:MAG: hypothetical protein QM759_05820 [Terricaulis sp.]